MLEVDDLHVVYDGDPDVHAVRGVSFTVDEGQNLGLVGESGCGKTTVANAIMGTLPDNGRIAEGEIRFEGENLIELNKEEMKDRRWEDIAMITQSAMNALNPVYTIGDQIREAIQIHRDDVPDDQARERARELLDWVGIEPDRIDDYPHQLSGGMRQRAIIAMSLALDPRLILADEPTTALDVIIQEQILYRIGELQQEISSSMIIITHDMSVVAETCDKVIVMYGGEVMEAGSTYEVFEKAHHPYTLGLRNAFPNLRGQPKDLISIPGVPPDLSNPPTGCPFRARCPFATIDCEQPLPERRVSDGHLVRCHEPIPFDTMQEETEKVQTWTDNQGGRHGRS